MTHAWVKLKISADFHPKRRQVFSLRQKEFEIKQLTVKYSDTSATFHDLSAVLDNGTLLAELHFHPTTTDLNLSSVNSTMREKGGVDAATLAKNWVIGIEAAKRTRLVTTQGGIRWMIHPSLTKRYKIPVTMFADTIYSKILSRQHNKASQVLCTDFGFVRAFPMKLESEAHEALSLLFHRDGVPNVMVVDGHVWRHGPN
jgi:hypothetical protein